MIHDSATVEYADLAKSPEPSFETQSMEFANHNLSCFERVVSSRMRWLAHDISDVPSYVRAYRNFPAVIAKGAILRRFPLDLKLRTPRLSITARGPRQVFLFKYLGRRSEGGTEVADSPRNLRILADGTVSFVTGAGLSQRSVTLAGVGEDGDLAIFWDLNYAALRLTGRTVIDVGASSGDSSILFALRGARRVVALEPAASGFASLCRNIEANQLGTTIRALRATLASRCGQSSHSWEIGPVNPTGRIPRTSEIVSLDCLTRQFAERDAVLKLDCEGCEYSSILGSDKETLRRYSQILVEYHFGYRNLVTKLLKAGFGARFTKPSYSRPASRGVQPMYSGIILADRRENG